MIVIVVKYNLKKKKKRKFNKKKKKKRSNLITSMSILLWHYISSVSKKIFILSVFIEKF